jgi:hypothetical protein
MDLRTLRVAEQVDGKSQEPCFLSTTVVFDSHSPLQVDETG